MTPVDEEGCCYASSFGRSLTEPSKPMSEATSQTANTYNIIYPYFVDNTDLAAAPDGMRPRLPNHIIHINFDSNIK